MRGLHSPWMLASNFVLRSAIALLIAATASGFPSSGELLFNPAGGQHVPAKDGSHKLHFHERSDHPTSINGTYRGTWQKLKYNEKFRLLELLLKEKGTIIYILKSTPTAHDGVLDVEGEVVLRDGMYVTEDDVLMKLRGVYVAKVGRLRAELESVQPLKVDVEPQDTEGHTVHYRQALRDFAHELSNPAWKRRNQGLTAKDGTNLPLKKRCKFAVDWVVNSVPVADASTAWEAEVPVGQNLTRRLAARPVQDPGPEKQSGVQRAAELVMNGTLYSDNCLMQLAVNATSTHIEAYYAKAVNYTLMITGISFIQVLLLIKQIESTNTPATVSKVSLLTIGHQAIMDAYLCLLHLTTGIMVEPLFNAFATAAFFEFVIFAIFEMRYLSSVWRARRMNTDPWTTQRELSMLYARFYGLLLGGILVTYQLQRYMRYLLFVLYSFWVPQIVTCVRNDFRQPLKPLYVIGMTITRLALPLYIHGCPRNVLRIPPQPWLCVLLTLYTSLQAGVLLLQYYYGPRCFILKRFLPAKYDYFRAVSGKNAGGEPTGDVEMGEGSAECVICMNMVDVQNVQSRMVTPCGHFFHAHCLQRWMDVKLECPTCRRPLPPP